MHDFVIHLVTLWLLVGVIALAIRAAVVEDIVDRVLAVDLLSLVAAATLVVVGIGRDEAGYLDGALALALLAFGQTVVVARFIADRPEMP